MKSNKMTRKMLAGILAVGMIAAAAVPAYATDEEKTEQMTVSFEKKSSYLLNIPAQLELSDITGKAKAIGVNSINLPTNKKLQIKVSSGIKDGKVTLTDENDAANTCSSTVSLASGGTGIADNAVVAEFADMSTEATSGGKLYFSRLENVQAGTYKGTITFVASIVGKTVTETP